MGIFDIEKSDLELKETISNYLNFICFSGKYAPNSSLNYLSDLNQYFEPLLQIHFFMDNTQKCIKFKPLGKKNLNTHRLDLSESQTQNKHNSSKAPLFEHESLESFIRSAYQNSKSKLAELSPTSRRRKLSSLKNFSKWCLEQNLLETDPMSSAPSTKLNVRLPEYLNLDEVLRYYQSLSSDYKLEPNKYKNELLSFLVFYGCGLRLDEACNIHSKDVDLKNARVLIQGKGSKERFAVLPDFVIQKLVQLWDQSDNYIYGKKPLVHRTVYNWVKKRGLKAGLHKPIHPHMFRHTFATHMLREKTDLRHLQELLGHSSLVATQRYTHLDKDQLLQSLESFHPLSNTSSKK